jgi:hypothetical protein
MEQERVIEQLDRMVASGRIPPGGVSSARRCEDAGVRRGEGDHPGPHARVHTDAAVAAGTMSPHEAEASLERVRHGDHSSELRRHIRGAG